MDVDFCSEEISEARRTLYPSEGQTEWIAEGFGGEVEPDDIGGDFADGEFDCGFDLPFL